MNNTQNTAAVIVIGLAIVAILSGVGELPATRSTELPAGARWAGEAMDLPVELRTENWGGGSCVHASTVSLLRWQGQYEVADWWRNQYSGGESDSRLIARMEAAGLRYAYTDTGDAAFIEWCCRTRRGAGIFYKPRHCVNVVDMTDGVVSILDNNAVDHYERIPREQFLRDWQNRYGGFAFTVVYDPPPPIPTRDP
jgi:hypothetical protein